MIDGWAASFDYDLKIENDEMTLFQEKIDDNIYSDIKLAKYGRLVSELENVLIPKEFRLDSLNLEYSSYMHLTGHITGVYCTSPFAKKREDSFILIWDGGMSPQLFHFKGRTKEIQNLGPLFFFKGGIYTGFAKEYSPFDKFEIHHYSVPGKLMAYIALGKINKDLLSQFQSIYNDLVEKLEEDINIDTIEWLNKGFIILTKNYCKKLSIDDKDILCTFHAFIEKMLIENLKRVVSKTKLSTKNLCIAGGCALSIKWNSGIRDSNIFSNIWVPPFPNDSGSAIGAACSAMIHKNGIYSLDWDVYSGPEIIENGNLNKSYSSKPFSIGELALLLHEKGEPVVFLNGRAELGPRALGNRSIIAPATNPKMKGLLNKIKGRENYRPVSPICIESDAPNIFLPGTPDPFMLFEHDVREEWKNKVPAITHLDGSARLQTLNDFQNRTIYDLLCLFQSKSLPPFHSKSIPLFIK